MSRWPTFRLEEVCSTTSGGTPSRSNREYFGGQIPWVKSGDLNDDIVMSTDEKITELGLNSSSAKLFPEGTVLIAMYGASVGKLGILNIPAATNQSICAITPGPNIQREYLFHFLRSMKNWLISASFGGAQPNISQKVVKSIQIPLPPLDEQRRIVDILNSAEGIRRLRREAQEKARQLIPALFVDMFGDPATNPKGWAASSLENVCLEIYRYPTYYGIEYQQNGIAEVRGELIDASGHLDADHSKYRYISQETSDRFPRTRLDVDDLIMSVRGTIGKIAIVPPILAGANITANLLRIAPDKKLVEPLYLKMAILTGTLRSLISSTTIQTIKAAELKKMRVLVPNLQSQQTFANRVADIQGTIAQQHLMAEAADRLQASLMAQVFDA